MKIKNATKRLTETPVIRMMSRAQITEGTDGKQERKCAEGKCGVEDTHHPRCSRVHPQKVEAGSVQIRCGCAATEHCRNTGVVCGGNPCYIVLDELELVNITHEVVRTRFLVTKQEEQRKKAEARKLREQDEEQRDE